MIAIITVGPPASGKSTYAEELTKHGFFEVSLDDCRQLLCGDHTNQEVTAEAVDLHNRIINERIRLKHKMVISDTNLNKFYRDQLDDKLHAAGYKVYYVVCNTPFIICQARNLMREKPVPFHAMSRMAEAMMEV